MSRQIDFDKPVTEDDVAYLKARNDARWETAEIEKPKQARKPKDD